MGEMRSIEEYKKEYEKITMDAKKISAVEHSIEKAKNDKKNRNIFVMKRNFAIAAAAAIAVCILPNISAPAAMAMENVPVLGGFFKLITIRDYVYTSETKTADVSAEGFDTAENTGKESDVLKRSQEEINREIEQATDDFIAEFEKDLHAEGYKDLLVSSERVSTSEDYFTIRLVASQTEASSTVESRYYTISTKTGERIELSDIFTDQGEYVSDIRKNIIAQMEENMRNDSEKKYWLNDDIIEMDLDSLIKTSGFYVNDKGELVMCFKEGDVAPMYMGEVQFTIPKSALPSMQG